MQMQSSYITNFTVLRGIGSLLVAFAHYQLFFASSLNPGTSLSMHQFYLAVDSFFIMSGFIMMYVYADKFKNGIRFPAFKDFMIARFGRIYPLHFFTLLVFVVIYAISRGHFSIVSNNGNEAANPHAILTHILLLQSFPIHHIYTWNIPSWSLSAEWWPYFTLPVIAWCYHAQKKKLVAALLIIIPLAYGSIMYLLPKINIYEIGRPAGHDLDTTFQYGFLRGMAGFFSGTLAYILFKEERIRKLFKSDFIYIALLAVTLGALYKDVNDLVCITLIAAFILCAAANTQKISQWSNNRVLQFLGDISYSVYMNHLLVIFLFKKIMTEAGVINNQGFRCPVYLQALWCLSFFAVVMGMSILTYYGIEVKFRKLINERWAHRKFAGQARLDFQR